MPLNFRHERYLWVPREPLGALRGADFELRGFLTYLAKFTDPKTGCVQLADGNLFRAMTLLCAVHPEERRAFRDLVPRLLRRPGVTVEEGLLTLHDVPGWQRSREPSRRIYATEPPAFARLPAYARFFAAEAIRSADEKGVFWSGTVESFARHYGMVATAHRRHDQRSLVRARIAAAGCALVVDGFLVATNLLAVKNFEAAQSRTDGGPARLPDASVPPTARLHDASVPPTARLHDASVPPTARLHDASRLVTARKHTPRSAEIDPFPTLPTLPTLPKNSGSGDAPAAPPAVFVVDQGILPGVVPPAPSRASRARSQPDALPFSPSDALSALQGSAKGRVVVGEPAQWTRSHVKRVEGHIRRFPSLEQWRQLGAWLASGGDQWRGTVGPGWAASDALVDAMIRAQGKPSASKPSASKPSASKPSASKGQTSGAESLDPLESSR